MCSAIAIPAKGELPCHSVYPCFSFLSHQNAICKPMAEIDDATKVFLMDPIQASS